LKRLSGTVRSLIASSLGLPGMQDLLAQEAPEEGLSYQFTHYDESPLPANRLAAGSPDRYTIHSQQLRWTKNLDDSYNLVIEGMYEGMSGSSPWFVIPDPEEGHLQVMSGATIRDHRSQVDVRLAHRVEDVIHTGSMGYSSEDDYQALYAGYAGERERSDGLSTFAWGASFSHDEIEPTDALLYGRVARASKRSFSVSGSVTRVLNPDTVVQSGLARNRDSGFLSDPYKRAWVAGFVVNDSRPDERFMWIWTTRYRQYLQSTEAALHLDGRYFGDNWGTHSLTLDLAWRQPIGNNWEIAPSLRYYSQTGPGFYGPVFDLAPADGYWSSDYRLATYGALSYRLQAILRLEKCSFSAFAEYYDSDESLALFGTPQDSPGLVDFWRLTARITVEL